MANTAFSYMYRDASNWKRFETVILEDELTPQDINLILNCLEDQSLFLPEQVGLPALQKGWETLNEDDHVWHELKRDDIQIVNESPTISTTTRELVEKFRLVYSKGWDVSKADGDLWEDAEIDYPT
jgi:hypothetical protein